MFNPNYETTLVSQLLNSIDNHLKIIHLPMKQEQSSEYNNSIDNNELWLSGHRSIFSSYGSHCQKMIPSFRNSQYEDFHWDLYENSNYHHLTFEQDQQNISHDTSLSEWSMHLNSDDTDDDINDTTSSSSDRPQTSWHAIKRKSINHSYSSSTNTSNSDHYSTNPLTLYHLFQRQKSKQHPCRLYENFSDKSMCDSLSIKQEHKIPLAITFSQLKLNNQNDLISSSNSKAQSKTNVDQCLQTSIIPFQNDNLNIIRSKSVDRLLKNPSQSSSIYHHSLPNLDFLTYYAKENPPRLSTLTNQTKPTMKYPLLLPKKITRTIFYCSIKIPNRSTSIIQKSRIIKEIKNIKTSPTIISPEEFSSICSSTSSSGYFSNTSTNQARHPLSSYPLKSCLKRGKTEELTNLPPSTTTANVIAGDIFTLSNQFVQNEIDTSKHRRYSSPTTLLNQKNFSLQFQTKNLSEHDLRAKKSVSFCNEIARRLITPSSSPKHRYQVPRESLTDSPPNEFNLSDNDDDNENKLINFIENIPNDITKPLPIKYGSDKYLIDAFANTILHILEIKCNDPKSFYLNNQINDELDRILRQDLCPLLREVLEDGLRQHSGSLFSKKVNLWRLIDLTTPTNSRFNEAKIKAQIGLTSTIDWIEKFNSFIYQLLNLHELASWLIHFISHRTLLNTYYESWAFVLININNNLFECITNQLEKLSPLSFQLKYTILLNSLTNQRSSLSILPKKFYVKTWLRDRKTQVKISSKKSVPPNITIRRKFNSIPVSK